MLILFLQAYKNFADTHVKRYLREFLGRSFIIHAIKWIIWTKINATAILGKQVI